MSFAKYANSSIGKKQMMAVSGFLLIGFLLAHLAGNFLIFAGYGNYNHAQAKIIAQASDVQKTELQNTNNNKELARIPEAAKANTDIEEIPINQYAAKLRSLGPLLWVARIGLLVIFVVHLFLFTQVAAINQSARPIAYSTKASKGKPSFAASTMKYTGIILFLYVIAHIADFTLHLIPNSPVVDGVNEGLYGLIINAFSNPLHAGAYIFAMIALGLHVSHAIQSACQTFGINHPRYTPMIKKASVAIGALISLSYISIPVYVFINHGLK